MPELLDDVLDEPLVILLGQLHRAEDPHAGGHVEGGEGEPVVEDVLLQVAKEEDGEGGEAVGVLSERMRLRISNCLDSDYFRGVEILYFDFHSIRPGSRSSTTLRKEKLLVKIIQLTQCFKSVSESGTVKMTSKK